jgi:hypothetical protein
MSYELDIGHGRDGAALKEAVDLSRIEIHTRRSQQAQWMSKRVYLYMQPHYVEIMNTGSSLNYITRRYVSVLTGDPATPKAFICWLPKKSRDAGVVLPSAGETIHLVDPIIHDLFRDAAHEITVTIADAIYNTDYTVASLTLVQ